MLTKSGRDQNVIPITVFDDAKTVSSLQNLQRSSSNLFMPELEISSLDTDSLT